MCPFFERGFCKLGGEVCDFHHPFDQGDGNVVNGTRVCPNYMLGFCALGPECRFVHIKNMVSPHDLELAIVANFCNEENWIDKSKISNLNQPAQFMSGGPPRVQVICHRCGQEGHKSTYCQEPKISQERLNEIRNANPMSQLNNMHVTCFTCNMKGHYAHLCPQKVTQASVQGGPGGHGNGPSHHRNRTAQEREKDIYDQLDKWQEETQYD
jgi:hypothetical protein